MKLEINTVDKTVKVMEDIPLKNLLGEIKKYIPDWKEYKLISYEEKWSYYPYYPTYPTYPYYPYLKWPLEITCGTTDDLSTIEKGIDWITEAGIDFNDYVIDSNN